MYNEFVVVDNWFTSNELNKIFKELDFLSLTKESSDNTKESSDKFEGPALDKNKKPKLKGYRIYPYDIYSQKGCKYSPILKSINKFQNNDFHKKVEEAFKNTGTALYEQFIGTNYSHTFINYYENNNFYKEHFDGLQFTALIFIFKEPKSFTGGDFYFTKINKKVECKNNRLVLFPSFYYHKTSDIKSKLNKENKGRYSIATLFSTKT